MTALLVSLLAGVGAVARSLVDRAVDRAVPLRRLPLGTLVINVTGSFLLGLLIGLAAHHGASPRAVAVLGAGFAGGFTTLSTFTLETVELRLSHRTPTAVLYVGLSVALGLGAAAAGLGLARV